MKKEDFKKIIKEEVKKYLNEGGDWIYLKSIGYYIDSEVGILIPKINDKPDLHNAVEQDDSDFEKIIKKADSNDKKTIKMILDKI